MSSDLVFQNAERWVLRPATNTLLWARFPMPEGPVDIWLPPRTTAAELAELIIPHLMKCVRLQVEWNESVQGFKEKMAPQLTPEELAALYSEL